VQAVTLLERVHAVGPPGTGDDPWVGGSRVCEAHGVAEVAEAAGGMAVT